MSVMSTLDLFVNRPAELGITKRCANCGSTHEPDGTQITTVVIDWRTDVMCSRCIANFDWSQWIFDPILNVYVRR
jgi:hypothetical protein